MAGMRNAVVKIGKESVFTELTFSWGYTDNQQENK